MRVRTALAVLLAVNVLWAAAFFGYIQRSTTPVVKAGAPTVSAKPTNAFSVSNPAVAAVVPLTNGLAKPTNTNVVVRGPKSLPSADKKFGWQDLATEAYLDYIASLRSVGCPEKQVRNIVVSDVNELFDKRRLEHAIKTDSQWWKADTFMGVIQMQNFGNANANFDEQRRELLTKILGEGWDDTIKLPSLTGSAVNLTGPVLGALPADTWSVVQEICQRSMDRHMAYQTARMNEGGGIDNVEMAKMRDMTRQDLSKVLATEQLEEFLLRYSHNSSKLRQDMRGVDLTPDEFRKIFRAIDPLEHQTQLDYGGPEALSPKQREQIEAQRDRAIREALSPQRYTQYLLTKDPLYRQAQTTAMQYGLNGKAVQPLYEMQKKIDSKRLEISQNTTLTPEQRAQALQSLSIEHQQTLQRLLGNVQYRQ